MQDALDRTFSALADPTRRAILARLASGEANVAELARPFAISQPAVSRHLKVLEAAGLIEGGRLAQARPRRLRPEALAPARAFLGTLWSDSFDRLAEMLAEDSAGPTDPAGNDQLLLGNTAEHAAPAPKDTGAGQPAPRPKRNKERP